MARPGKHWLNPKLQAANVLEIDVPEAVIARLQPYVAELQAGSLEPGEVRIGGHALHVKAPRWRSDIRWISQGDERSYAFFESLFDELGLAARMAPHIDYDRAIRLYSGFFVTRSRCAAPDFHLDWVDGGNQAFTFLAPLSANCGAIPLQYRTFRGEVAEYRYRLGRGLVLGDLFHHSTGAGEASEPVVLLSFTFGTDRMADWPRLQGTGAKQGRLHRRPDGVFVDRGKD